MLDYRPKGFFDGGYSLDQVDSKCCLGASKCLFMNFMSLTNNLALF